jgi:hypothetical protein
MKKSILSGMSAIIILASVITPHKAHAQKYKGQSVVTGGVGWSVVGLFLGVIDKGLDAASDVRSTKTPVIMGAYDFGLSDRFSIGAHYTYQSLTLRYDGYTTFSSTGFFDSTVTGSFRDRLLRQSIGIRPLFHFGDNDDLDIYAGLRLSFLRWSYKSTRSDLGDDFATDILKAANPIKVQGVFGVRYFFTENIGFNTEFAIGPAYFAMIGINARFGGN